MVQSINFGKIKNIQPEKLHKQPKKKKNAEIEKNNIKYASSLDALASYGQATVTKKSDPAVAISLNEYRESTGLSDMSDKELIGVYNQTMKSYKKSLIGYGYNAKTRELQKRLDNVAFALLNRGISLEKAKETKTDKAVII